MTSISIKEYYAQSGSRFSNKDAAIIGPVLVELSEKGGVTARDVVDVAKSQNSPIHSYFEWNNEVAADLFRLEQARNLMRSIRVIYEDEDKNQHTGRIVQAVTIAAHEDAPRKYHSFRTLHGDTLFAAKLLGTAIDDLKSWRRKYEPYIDTWDKFEQTLQAVANQVSEFEEEVTEETPEFSTDAAVTELIQWREKHIGTISMWRSCHEQVKYIIEAISDAEKTFLALNTFAYRKCMTCGSEFESISSAHRICNKCVPKTRSIGFDERTTGAA